MRNFIKVCLWDIQNYNSACCFVCVCVGVCVCVCVCVNWSRTLREECRLRVLENRVLRRIFGLKRDEVTRAWRKLHNEELNDRAVTDTQNRALKEQAYNNKIQYKVR